MFVLAKLQVIKTLREEKSYLGCIVEEARKVSPIDKQIVSKVEGEFDDEIQS